MAAVIVAQPLGVLVSNGEDVPFASHLPFIVDEINPNEPKLSGSTLLGHMDRSNPQWRALRNGSSVKVIFSGPNSYITPTIYRTEPAAPTWDYVAVHVTGTVHPLPRGEVTMDVVLRTVRQFEGEFGTDWQPDRSLDYFNEILPGVGAFRLVVSAAEGMFKLSQEKSLETRTRVVQALDSSPSEPARDLARLMKATEPATRFECGSG